jgi:ferrochelatase
VRKGDESGTHCLHGDGCCDALDTVNRHCYRAQCYATSRLLAEELTLTPDRYQVTFQSRLGRVPWIKPYTDVALRELPKRGVKRLAVLCPAFVADCLETLEEIGLRGKDTFLAAGGEAFHLVPSLNAHPMWVEAVAEMVRGAVAGAHPGEHR